MSTNVCYPRPAALNDVGPGHLVVAASAGTGKTFLLEHLFVDLILRHGVPADQILVVTYTEKAVAELNLRVRRLLQKLADLKPGDPDAIPAASNRARDAWTIDETARARLSNVLQNFDQLSIATIHGFCQRVLRENAFAHGRMFEEELVDRNSVVGAAFRDTLRGEVARDAHLAAAVSAWLGRGDSVAEIEKLLRECDAADAEVIVPRIDEQALASAMAAWPPWDDEDLRRRMKLAKVNAGSAKATLARLRRVSDLIAAAQGNVIDFVASMDDFFAENSKEDPLSYIVTNLDKASGDAQLAAFGSCVRGLQQTLVSLPALMVGLLHPRVQTLAASRKRQKGEFDYADMLHLLAEALDADTPKGRGLLLGLRRRYRYALIDEFQDTDPVQWSIFRRIFVESRDGHALAVIGDPKQSIYRFRGADVHTYLAACGALRSAGAREIPLDHNHRSSKEMIEATNLIFAEPAGFFRAGSGIAYERPVRCGRTDLALLDRHDKPLAPVLLLAPNSASDPLHAAAARGAVRAAIVEEIRRLLDDPPRLREPREKNGERPLGPSDIFVLTFTNKESREMGRALAEAAIPFAFYKLGGLFESPEAADVLALLRAIVAPSDRNLRNHALLTPFFALDLVEAAILADRGAEAGPLRLLFELAALAEKGDIPRLFSTIIERTGVIRRQILAQNKERSLTNLLHLFEMLQGEWARARRSLPELVETLEALVRGTRKLPGEEGDLQRLETDQSAVQILTVHKAKGLEANVVFVYGGTGEPNARKLRVLHRDGRREAHVGRLGASEKQQAVEEEAAERSRLLYVACTRARVRLALPHYPATFNRLKGPYLQMNQRLDQLLAAGDPRTSALFRAVPAPDPTEVAVHEGPTQPRAPLAEASLVDELASPAPPPELEAIKRKRSGFLVTSYTAVKHAHGGFVPLEDHADAKRGSEAAQESAKPEDGLPGGAATGIFLHELLATVPLDELAQAPSFEAWSSSPRAQGLLARLGQRFDRPERELPAAARLVYTAYRAPLRLLGSRIDGLAATSPSLREMEFLYPIPESSHRLLGKAKASDLPPSWRVERGLVKGFVDLLFEHQGKVFVCDWKSDSLSTFDADALARHCRQNYDVQARLYTMAALRLFGIGDADDFARRFGGVVFCFLRGRSLGSDQAGIHFQRPSWQDVLSWETEMLGPRFWGTEP